MENLARTIENVIAEVPSFSLWIVFSLALVAVIPVSLVLRHHWNSYGQKNILVRKGKIIYILGMFILISVAGVAAFIFQNN